MNSRKGEPELIGEILKRVFSDLERQYENGGQALPLIRRPIPGEPASRDGGDGGESTS